LHNKLGLRPKLINLEHQTHNKSFQNGLIVQNRAGARAMPTTTGHGRP
jgi:hypothetical protein